MVIRARFECPACKIDSSQVGIEPDGTMRCEHCDWTKPVVERSLEGERLFRCPLCGTDEMYVQKDFPERVGLLIVVSGVVIASIFWYNYSWIGAIGTLVVFGVIDWILFHTRKEVTVCYRCLSQFRDMDVNPEHKAHDLAIGERFRQERIRKEMRQREEAAAARAQNQAHP